MAEAQDVNTLKRRGRRRLVGAIALVLLAVIVLPMVFDSEPRQPAPPVEVRIPRQDTNFKPELPARPAAPEIRKPAEPTPERGGKPAEHAQSPSAPARKAAATPHKKTPRPSATERARAEAALAGVEYFVPVAALADSDRVKALTSRLKAAKVPYYTEPIATASGRVTRVRAGPFVSREAAERAHAKLKGLGLKPGNVTTKS